MRLLSTILFSLLLTITVFSNNDDVLIHPFAYVTYQESDFDIQVMDLNTGQIIHSIATDGDECPESMSPNRQYLHYSIGGVPFMNMLLNIHTGETIELPATNKDRSVWSSDSKHLAYLSHNEDYNTLLNIYDVASESVRTILQDNITIYQWHTDELVFVTLDTETSLLEIFSWDGEDIEQIQVIDSISNVRPYNMALSPDVSYLSVGTRVDINEPNQNHYLINIETGHINELDHRPNLGPIVWHPSELMFVTMGERIQVTLYDLQNDTVEMIDLDIHGYHRDILWSPDGEYLLYQYGVPGGTLPPSYKILAYQLDSQDSFVIDETNTFSCDIRWISETQLIYNYASLQTPLDYSLNDLVLYDINTNERTLIADTQDIGEEFSCRYG